MRALSVIALLGASTLLACGGTRPCKDQTVFVNITLQGAAASADTLDVSVSVNGMTLNASGAHTPGVSQGTIELQFPSGYPAGQSITVTVNASASGQPIGTGSIGPVPLNSGCTTLAVTILSGDADLSVEQDLSGVDLAGAIDLATDDAAVICTPNREECDAANQAVLRCSPDGTSLDQIATCPLGCLGGRCKQCLPASKFCSDTTNLATCGADGFIESNMQCTFGCQLGACNTCLPNEDYCSSGTTSTACKADGTPGASTTCSAAGCNTATGQCNNCTPNTTTCQTDNLVVCDASGVVTSSTRCNFGCLGGGAGPHCGVLTPLFSTTLPPPTGTLPDITINATSTLNITNCAAGSVTLTIGTGTPMTLTASSLPQTGGPTLCQLKVNTFTIDSGKFLEVVNDANGYVLSLQSRGRINIPGRLWFINNGKGPRQPIGHCRVWLQTANSDYRTPGVGGGGNQTAGLAGGGCTTSGCGATLSGGAGGAAIGLATIKTLFTAGSKGGEIQLTSSGTTCDINYVSTLGVGGLGGGGLHLVSLDSVVFGSTAEINLNGRGGQGPGGNTPAGGGGSGGTLIVEAPSITVAANAGITANGGGGASGCYKCFTIGPAPNFVRTYYWPPCSGSFSQHFNGQDGQIGTATVATGGSSCENISYGKGGSAAGSGQVASQAADSTDGNPAAGSGGGGIGWILFRARSITTYMPIDPSAILSPPATKETAAIF